MRHFILGFLFITIIAFAYQEPIEGLQHVLVYPTEPNTKRVKRQATTAVNTKSEFHKFVEERLIQHSAALEHLVKLAQKNEETIQHLIEVLSINFMKPKLPEKLEVQHKSSGSSDETDLPLARFVRNVPKYGTLLKDIVLGKLRNDEDPVAVAEHDISRFNSEDSWL